MQEERVLVQCPHCRAAYKVRCTILGREAKCPQCQKVFALIVPDYHSEDEIFDWLQQAPASSAQAPDATAVGLKVTETDTNGGVSPEKSVSDEKPVEAVKKLYLHSITDMGAYFWFAAESLAEPEFRASLPQLCASCMTDSDLYVHLVQWPSKLPGWEAIGKRELRTKAVIRLEELPKVDPVALLTYLPRQENLPFPYRLPFPYYVCGHCSPSGLVHTNTSFSGGLERCWLTISNLDIATGFYSTLCGADDDSFSKLCKSSELSKKDRWQLMPLAMRNRISQWFKPQAGEHFVDYLPDEDFSKTEAGAAGLVITDRRSVYHKYQTWREYPLTDAVTVTTKSTSVGARVEMYSVGSGRCVLKLDSKSWISLKQHMKGLQARVKFLG